MAGSGVVARFRFDIVSTNLKDSCSPRLPPYVSNSVYVWESSSYSRPASTFLDLHRSREFQNTRNEIMKMVKISNDSIPRPQPYSFGRLTSVLCILLASWVFLLHGTTFERPSRDHQPEDVSPTHLQPTLDPAQSNHRTEVVQWDQHSLIIHGQRVLLWCVLSVYCLHKHW